MFKTTLLRRKGCILTQITKKNVLTFVRRRSREIEGINSPNVNVDDLTYYKQMKEFIKETQGVPKNSLKWQQLRTKHYRILQDIYIEQQKNKIKETFETSFMRFYLLLVPESTECYEVVSLLNYYKIRYKAFEDSPVSKSIMKQLLGPFSGQSYKKYNYPFLIFESSEEPSQYINGMNEIFQFLIENKFIHDFRTQSAYEKDGIEFCKEMEKIIDKEFKRFSNKFSFYFRGTNFKEARYGYNPYSQGAVYRSRLMSKLYRLLRSTLYDLFTFKKKKHILKENHETLKFKIENWVLRLNENPFHGGDVPDAADFKLYSLFRKSSYYRDLHFKIKKLKNMKFDDWYSKMDMLCQRGDYYNIKEVSYNYNPHMNEEEREEEKYNKNDVHLQKNNSPEKLIGAFSMNKRRSKINI
jgi:hypothetical protein